MSQRDSKTDPTTPVLVKTSPDLDWPEEERVFYLVGREGLFICRNGEFFRSCVPAPRGPSALASQGAFLAPRFPRIPRAVFEQTVGFFDRVAELHGSEAAALLVWDRREARVRLVVPQQIASVYRAWDGYRSALDVQYTLPTDLPPHQVPFGDVHSHVYMAAYASGTDVKDEVHAAGLHIVVGRLHKEPPEIHVEAVVDGTRFVLGVDDVIEDYVERRLDVPPEWIERVSVEESSSYAYPGRAS